ncbi:MAG: hypothetical protein P1U85_10085 [Verrucomicrobiales bacterium]|nr:hypothetical protein [Verrucomicrobiales bacterium]
MKKLIVVVNDLERSGKSALARAISHHLGETEVNHLLVSSNEMDMSDSFRGEFWDLEDQFDVSELIGALDSYDAIVVDVHTGAARNWGEFCESTDLENLLAEIDAEMTLVIPNNQSERCNEEITDIAEIFADQADYVVAQMPGDERAIKWKASPAEKALRYLGAAEVTLPAISDELTTAMESSEIELKEALNQPSELPRFAEVQVSQWLEEVSSALTAGQDYLLPEEVVAVALDY